LIFADFVREKIQIYVHLLIFLFPHFVLFANPFPILVVYAYMYIQWSIIEHTYKRTRRFLVHTRLNWPFDHFQYCLKHSMNANI